MKKIVLVFLLVLSILAVSCGANNPAPANVTVNETSADVAGATEETIRMNNCGGPAPVEQTAKKSKSVNVEGGASLGLDVYVVKGEVAARYGEISESSKEIKLTALAGTNMEFTLRWMEKTWAGSVTAQGKNGQANYTVSVPVSVDMVSSVDIGCPTTPQPANVEVSTPSFTYTAIPLSLGDNLLQNSGFDRQIQNSGWERGGNISMETSYNGSQAVCSTQNNANDGFLWIGIAQNVSVVPGQTYLAKAWLKWENAAQVNLQIWWLDSNGQKKKEDFPVCCYDGNSENWVEKSGNATAPSWATSARVMIFHGVANSSKVSGSKVCIDDMVFAPIR